MRIQLGLLTLFCVPLAYGQDTRGQIIGRVEDATGAVVAGAKVRGVHVETNVASSVTSNHTGDYVLPFLIPGTYTLAVEMDGFRRFLQKEITVQVDDKITINVKLKIGATSDSVQVVADSPLIDAADASIGQVVDSKSLVELPLKDGNPIMLAELSPGVMNLSTGGMTRPFDNGNTSSMAINGGRSGTNEYKIDGAPNTSGGSGNIAYIPPPGVVSEVKIQTSPFDASSGFATGGSINVSLKSGTNQVHGQAYYFLQNPALNANAYFSNFAGLPKDNYRQNRWGLNGNGPAVIPHLYNGRNRTFWMYGYEGIRDSLPRGGKSNVYTVPTAEQRNGDFSGLLALGSRYQVYDPATGKQSVSGSTRVYRDPFPGNIIPASRINAIATNVVKTYIPVGNVPGTVDGLNNLMLSLTEKNQFMSHVFRIDHSLNEKNRFFFRGSANNRYQDYQRRFNNGGGYDYWRNNRGFGIDDVHMFSPSLLLNVRYNYTRFIERTNPLTLGIDLGTLGFSQKYVDQIKAVSPDGMMLPNINITNSVELNAQSKSRTNNDIHALAFAFTKMRGRHTLTFGGEDRLYRDTKSDSGRTSGNLAFNTNYTKGPADNASSAPVGQGFASFLLGQPTGGYYDRNDSYAQQYQISGWYFQDSWKLTTRLTVNLGIRYELEVPTTERYDRAIRGFDFNTPWEMEAQVRAIYAQNPIPEVKPADFKVRGGLLFAGVGGNPRTLWESNKHNFAPRAAIAWQLNSKTVLRTGFGIFYDIARQKVDQTGFSRRTTLIASQDTGRTFVGTLNDPFPNGFLAQTGNSLGIMTNAGQNVNPSYTNLKNPYVQRWQASVQRRLGRQALLEIAYVGNRANRLRVSRNSVDSVPQEYLSTLPYRDDALNSRLTRNVSNPYFGLFPGMGENVQVQVQQLLRPYSQFTGGSTISNEGFSWYHSTQTRVEKRFSSGYLLTGAWTWSKFMEANEFLNNTDVFAAHSISDQDRTHRFAGSAIYELPFGKRKRWAASWKGYAGKLVSGWQIQGIYQWQSGVPLSFGDVPFFGIYKDIPVVDQRTVQRWFNVDAGFERSSNRKFAYHLRTFPLRMSGLRGMGLNMFDLSASKNTRLTERTTIQFRAEFNNALNHAHFGTPQMDPTNTDFGRVTSTAQMPRNIQFGLKIVF